MNPFSPVEVAHRFVRSVVRRGDLCIDATLGNGHDTVFLADLVGKEGRVYGFDIQSASIEISQTTLASRNLEDRVTLFHQGHETVGDVLSESNVQKPAVVMFNLGYLPGSDKSVTTKAESTLKALESILPQLAAGGAISIVAYRGHPGGEDEYRAIESWLHQLPLASYFWFRFERWSDKRGLTPVFFWVRRLDKGIA